jgi:hypothetical protein
VGLAVAVDSSSDVIAGLGELVGDGPPYLGGTGVDQVFSLIDDFAHTLI